MLTKVAKAASESGASNVIPFGGLVLMVSVVTMTSVTPTLVCLTDACTTALQCKAPHSSLTKQRLANHGRKRPEAQATKQLGP